MVVKHLALSLAILFCLCISIDADWAGDGQQIVLKGNNEPVFKFGIKLAKAIKHHKQINHIVTKLEIIFYTDDSPDWEQGDIRKAIIYYLDKPK